MAGYSGTPLAKKLGIVPGCRVLAIAAPKHYRSLLEPLPRDVAFVRGASDRVTVFHLFCKGRQDLQKQLTGIRKAMAPDAAVWVSWPKKASKVPTDVTEDVIRAVGLPMGLVDIKVCAVDETWSGLKLVVRKELR